MKSKSGNSKTRESVNFETALLRLGEIVSALERDDTSLADALALYEEGISVANQCRSQLDDAELRITELSKTNRETDQDRGETTMA